MGLATLIEKVDTLREEINLIIQKAIVVNEQFINTGCHKLYFKQSIDHAIDLIKCSFQYGIFLCKLNDKLVALDKLRNKAQSKASEIKNASYFACLYHSILIEIKKNNLVEEELISLKNDISNNQPISPSIKNTVLDLLENYPELTINDLIDSSEELKEKIKTSLIIEKIDDYKNTLNFEKRMPWAIYSKFIIIHKVIDEIEENLCEYFSILDKTMKDFVAFYLGSDKPFKENLTLLLNKEQTLKQFITPWLVENKTNNSMKSPLTLALQVIKNSNCSTANNTNNIKLKLTLSNRY